VKLAWAAKELEPPSTLVQLEWKAKDSKAHSSSLVRLVRLA
jgi:hypothetical protein